MTLTAAAATTTGSDPGIRRALDALSAGRPVIVVDDEDRENEGDLIFAAELATPALMAFLVRHSSGFVCVALPGPDCDRLGLPPMHQTSTDHYGTAYCVTADAVGGGTTTGVSATDRARTARALADPASGPRDFSRPGHVVPLRARPGGVLERAGHTEAAVDLMTLAGLRPAGVLCEIVSTRHPTRMARRAELRAFAAAHDLEMVSIAQLAGHRRRTERQVVREVPATVATTGQFRTIGYRGTVDGAEHLAFICGEVEGRIDVPVHVHHECVPGEVLGAENCDCHTTLAQALTTIERSRCGIVVYLRPPSEPPPGRATQAQVVADILADLGAAAVRLLPVARHTPDPGTAPSRWIGLSGTACVSATGPGVSERTGQIVDAARVLIDEGGSAALTMRALGDRLGIRAPSLYKHFPDKGAVEAQVITLAMRELASALARTDSLVALAATYRAYALAHPHLYRLMNSGPLPRHLLPPGVEEATTLPLVRAVGGEMNRARAVWAFAHGMVILELDGRFPPDADLDSAWRTGLAAFADPARHC